MDYEYSHEYTSFRKEIDLHNKCCGGLIWCIRDICGIICAVLTWLLILYAEFVVMTVILIPSPYPVYSAINTIIFQTCAFMAFASHLRTMFTDPVCIPTHVHVIVQCKYGSTVIYTCILGCCSKGQCYKRNDQTNGV